MPVDHFGEEVAARYDDGDGDDGEFSPAVIERTVDVLAALAGDGPALEFAIGTGRIALPLAARGVRVAGIDLSEAMVARLRAKPGGDALEVAIGDFATTRVDGSFTLVYLVFNTIGNLTSQDWQVACFENAAAHLRPGGAFLIETGVPDLQRLPRGERHRLFHFSHDRIGIDELDVVTQRMVSHHYAVGGELRSIPFRYVWPSELDLMGRIAGMRLESRWAGWSGEPFTAESTRHVSVWRSGAS
jgi:SAM-dependent methyltransferase